jgi:E3 ubiquitin-protein ligase HERC4
VFSWGGGGSGQLGVGYKKIQSSPLLVQSLLSFHVIQIACGGNHCIALTRQPTGARTVLTWGNGVMGQLGLGDNCDQAFPRHVKSLEQERVTYVAAGKNFSFAVAGNL